MMTHREKMSRARPFPFFADGLFSDLVEKTAFGSDVAVGVEVVGSHRFGNVVEPLEPDPPNALFRFRQTDGPERDDEEKFVPLDAVVDPLGLFPFPDVAFLPPGVPFERSGFAVVYAADQPVAADPARLGKVGVQKEGESVGNFGGDRVFRSEVEIEVFAVARQTRLDDVVPTGTVDVMRSAVPVEIARDRRRRCSRRK